MTQNAVPPAEAYRLYAEGDGSQRWTSVLPFGKTKTQETVAALDALVKPGMRVLDVGCNTGELLDHVRSRGARTCGVEPSEGGRRVALAKGHDVRSVIEEHDGSFEVITAFDVLEHIYDVPETLRRWSGRLSRGGALLVLTGDVESPGFRRWGASWWYAQYPEHVVFPSKWVLSQLCGLTLEEATATFADRAHEPDVLTRAMNRFRGRAEDNEPDHFLGVFRL